MCGLLLPDLFLKAYKRTECFKLKLNTYLAFKITFNKEHLPLLPIQLAEF
jgi:UDP-glucose 6-dehydrogenase